MPTNDQHQIQQKQPGEQENHPLDQESESLSLAPPPFQLQASAAMPPPPASNGRGPIQRKIGPNGDGKRVRNKNNNNTFLAKKQSDGSYDLYFKNLDGQWHFKRNVKATDKNYEIIHEMEEEDLSESKDVTLKSDQEARRVYSTVGQDQADFSYSDLSAALDTVEESTGSRNKARKRGSSEMLGSSVVPKGMSSSVSDGTIAITPKLNHVLQLIATHILKYQLFHTPPDLKTDSRRAENEWRQHELDTTLHWLEVLRQHGLREMLPKLVNGTLPSSLREIYPGPIDIGFPPNEAATLFTYADNKAVFLLMKRLLLSAYQKEKANSNEDLSRNKRRKIATEALEETITGQDRSVVDDPEEYLGMLGLKRTDSGNSHALDEQYDEEESFSDIYDSDDDLDTATDKRDTFVHTLGITAKLTNRKLMQDQVELEERKETKEQAAARASFEKHERMLQHLDVVQEAQFEVLNERFEAIVYANASYARKRKMLDELKPKVKTKKGKAAWQKYDAVLESYREESIGDIRRRKNRGALAGIGQVTLEREVGLRDGTRGSSSSSKPKNKASAKPKPEPQAETKGSSKGQGAAHDVHSLAATLGGTAQYGDNNNDNCLIYGLAFAMRMPRFTKRKADQIRANIGQHGLIGVEQDGFLPGYGRVADRILQFLLADQLDRGAALPQVTVHIHSLLPGVASQSEGMGPTRIDLIHDGVHFWWVKPN